MKQQRYWVRVMHDDGKTAVLTHRGRSEWTKKTAMRHADDCFNRHGWVCYVIPA